MESALQQAFGAKRTMLDWSENTYSTKVAVTATTVADSSPCLLPNYTGVMRGDHCGKLHGNLY